MFHLDYVCCKGHLEPSTAADQRWNLIIQSLLSPSLSFSFPLSVLSFLFPLPPSLTSFPAVWNWYYKYFSHFQKWGETRSNVWEDFLKQLWFLSTLQLGPYMIVLLRPLHASEGSYIDAVCVLKVTLCVPELIASHFDVDWVLTAACAC